VQVSVIGRAHLGAVHAASLAQLAHDVVGVDVDAERVEALAAGKAPFFEPGLDDLLSQVTGPGRLAVPTDMAADAEAQVHPVCVGLSALGAVVTVHDPQVIDNARAKPPLQHDEKDVGAALAGADAVPLLTEWKEYRGLDPERVGTLVAQRTVLDGRNALSRTAWTDAGWQYRALGRR